MRIIFLFSLLYWYVFLFSYSQVHTPLDSLIQAVELKHARTLNADIEQYKEKKNLDFLHYLPGIGYDFLNNRPVFTYNLSTIARFFNSRQRKKYKIKSIKKHSTIKIDEVKKRVATAYNHLRVLFSSYALEISIYKKYFDLYKINKEKYENQEITIAEFTRHQIKIQERQKILFKFKDKIFNKITEIEQITNYSLSYEIADFNTSI